MIIIHVSIIINTLFCLYVASSLQVAGMIDEVDALKVKVKVRVYNPDILVGSTDFTSIAPIYWNLRFHSINIRKCFASVAIHTVLIFVPLGTHYCRVDRGGVDSKLAQGFYT